MRSGTPGKTGAIPEMNNRFCMENWVAECINFANKNEKM